MENTITFVISVLMGTTSIVLAVVAIWMSKVTERESRANYEKTKDALATVEKTAEVIEKTVSENQKQLLNTVTDILRETTVPPKEDAEEQVKKIFLQAIASDPEKFMKIMAEIGNQQNK